MEHRRFNKDGMLVVVEEVWNSGVWRRVEPSAGTLEKVEAGRNLGRGSTKMESWKKLNKDRRMEEGSLEGVEQGWMKYFQDGIWEEVEEVWDSGGG